MSSYEKHDPPSYGGPPPQQAGYAPPMQGYGHPMQPAGQPQAGFATNSQTTVIVNQPLPGSPAGRPRMWTSGMCDCFDDMGICLCGWFCGICLACQVAADIGESSCVPCCVPGWLTAMRVKWRTQENIEGSICDDCIMSEFCGICTLCQLAREVKKKKNGVLYTHQ